MTTQNAFSPEFLELAGDSLRLVDDRIRSFDLTIHGLIREAEAAEGSPSVPNRKRITELTLLLLQIRDLSNTVNEFLMRCIGRCLPAIESEGLRAIEAGLGNLEQLLRSEVGGVPFVAFVKRYLETIDYPGYSQVEKGITELTSMEAYKVAYTPGVAQMCLLIQALHTHMDLLNNLSFMDLRGMMRKVIHVLQDRLSEALRSLTGATGSIHVPRLSHGIQWRNPANRRWETHPVLRAARAYIASLRAPVCLVVTDQTAVLGLEDIGPRAGHPVMVGKAKINASAGRFTALPVSIDSTADEEIVEVTRYLAESGSVRSVNLEDITGRAGRCFAIQRRLQQRLPIPIFHDDQDGTAIITLAGLLTALADQEKRLEDVRIVMSGAGAAGIKIARFLLNAGAPGQHIVMLDSRGLLSAERPDLSDDVETNEDFARQREKIVLLADIRADLHGAWARACAAGQQLSRPDEAMLLADRTLAMRDADVFIGMSSANILTVQHLRSMAPRPIVFACANPEPEIPYSEAVASRDDLIFGSGSSLFPNQINNAVAFPGFLAGLMFAQARSLDIGVGVRAAEAIAARTRELREADPSYREVVPQVIDIALHRQVAEATLEAVFARELNVDPELGVPERQRCLQALQNRFACSP